MRIIRTFTTSDLGKTMPAELPCNITAGEHFSKFYALDTCDVWTADGWVVTAVQDDGVTHHLRKGRDVMVAEIQADAVFRFNPTPKARYLLGLA
jgi:hypothetical protein